MPPHRREPDPGRARRPLRVGLTARLALLTAVIAIALVLGATEVALRWTERSRLDDARIEALTVANTLASYLTSAAPRGNPTELTDAFGAWAQHDVSGSDAALYLRVRDSLAVATAVDSSLLTPADSLDRVAMATRRAQLAFVQHPEAAWRVAVPLGAHRPFGVLAMSLSAQRLIAQSSAERRRAYALALASALLVAGGVTALTARWVGRPLETIGRAMAGAHAGAGAAPPAPETGPTEFRALAEQYNALRTALAERERESEGRAALLALEERARGLDRLAASAATAGAFAHEIGTPLNTMRGHLQLLRDDLERADNAAGVERVNLLIDQVDRVTGIVRGGLDAHTWPDPQRRDTDVVALVRHLLDFLAPSFAEGRITGTFVTNGAGAGRVIARTDPALLEQILLNLLKNAMEALPPGGGIRVRVGHAAGTVALDVEDDGPGLPAGVRAQLFRPFTTTKRSGTGLGLAVSHRLARALGGELNVVPVARGTCWRLTFPARGPAEGAAT